MKTSFIYCYSVFVDNRLSYHCCRRYGSKNIKRDVAYLNGVLVGEYTLSLNQKFRQYFSTHSFYHDFKEEKE